MKEAEEIVEEFSHLNGNRYVSSYDWAMVYAGKRGKEKTLQWLEKGYEERNGRLVNLAVHPQFAFLHSDPGFQRLLKEIGIASALAGPAKDTRVNAEPKGN
jgi:hypothetical protein